MTPLRSLLFLCLTLLAAVACSAGVTAPGTAVPPTVAVTAAIPATPWATGSRPAAIVEVRPSPSVTPASTPTIMPTPLPAPRVAVPATWETEVREAGASTGAIRWDVIVADDPLALLSGGQVQVALVPGTEGIPAGQRPLVLAVPFGSQWEAVTSQEARAIQEQGHSVAQVVPWDALQPWQRGLHVDGMGPSDPGYPLQQPWSLVSVEGYESAAEALGQQLRANAAPFDFSLVAVGDIMLDRALGAAISQGDVGFPFALVRDVLAAGNVTVGNLESALGDAGEPEAKSYTFRAPPQAAHSLAAAGFDLVSLANNHALDFGPAALEQGTLLLNEAGLGTIGAGENEASARAPYLVEEQGKTLAFLGYAHVPVEGKPPYFDTKSWSAEESVPGLAWAHLEHIQEDVIRAGARADHVIVVLHSGFEYVPSPSPAQQDAAHAAIDAGATMVIGHHAHILQGVEFYKDGVIVYGLGNFAFTITGPPETAILEAYFDENGLRQLKFVPAIVQPSGQPRLANDAEAAAIRNRLYALTGGLN